ncbi:DUF6011 domain-containing protein [Gracilibacillus oryzae]|uniref:DUF6011 domain-containing protein n=1 Tax=Gracilibacillus oryzae TaxID=1672701 RepID=UPI0012976FF8|nr:DUF6011 domain-containing protein [Gracilibacillus oryzae]
MGSNGACATCGRKLIDKKSMERGFGPVCYEKYLKAKQQEDFERNQITVYEALGE